MFYNLKWGNVITIDGLHPLQNKSLASNISYEISRNNYDAISFDVMNSADNKIIEASSRSIGISYFLNKFSFQIFDLTLALTKNDFVVLSNWNIVSPLYTNSKAGNFLNQFMIKPKLSFIFVNEFDDHLNDSYRTNNKLYEAASVADSCILLSYNMSMKAKVDQTYTGLIKYGLLK